MIEKLKEIIAEKGLTSSKFADEIGVQRSSISHILSKRNKPSLEFVQKILKRFPDINSDWLISGKGKMKNFQNSNLFSQQQTSNTQKNDFKEENEISKFSEETISDISTKDVNSNQKITSSAKLIERVIVFYSDKTFDIYNQTEQ